MIYHAVTQNTPEWEQLRLGIPCSSEFHKLITPKTKQPSKQAPGVMYRLLAEWMTGAKVENDDEYRSEWMDRGHAWEDRAVMAYEMLTDTETHPGGFITTDDGMIGCSPDRLVGEVGDCEIKCPLIHTQIKNALTGTIDDDYKCQLQGRLMIHRREWIDIFSYHPQMVLPAVRVVRDEDFIKDLSAVLKSFNEIMLEKRLELERRFGPFVRPEPPPKDDHSNDFLTDADAEAIIQNYRERDVTP